MAAVKKTKAVKKTEMWRRYKGTTAEELCAAIRELWLAKYPNYIRMLNEVPNRLIEDIAAVYGSRPTMPMTVIDKDGSIRHTESGPEGGWPGKYYSRTELRELEKFLDQQPFGDHFCIDQLDDELYWKNPDAPLSEFVEADKKQAELVEKYSIRPPTRKEEEHGLDS
jgi:hypothetical protein